MAASQSRTRPNVVLIVADDLGYGDLSCYGNTILSTPNIDRLAAEGVRCSQHYSGAPICAPARAALLTGRYHHRCGVLSVESNRGLDRIALRERTIGDVFGGAGYRTGYVGKWHSGLHDRRYHPNQRGFAQFAGFLSGIMDYWDWFLDYNGSSRRADGRYQTDVFTAEAVDFIRALRSGARRRCPATVPAGSGLPRPARAPAGARGELRAVSAARRPEPGTGHHVRHGGAHGSRHRPDPRYAGGHRLRRRHRGAGHQRQRPPPRPGASTVERRFSMERFNGPFRGQKQDVLEGGIRVPAIVRWPDGLPAGTACDEMIHFCDWLPTLAAAAGVVPDGEPLDGCDQLPGLRGTAPGGAAPRFWQFNRYDPVPGCNLAMRDGPWKLYWPRIPEAMVKLQQDNVAVRELMARPHYEMEVRNPPVERTLSAPGEPELYHIRDDPSEARNLAAAHPDRVARMRLAAENWFAEVEAERREIAAGSS